MWPIFDPVEFHRLRSHLPTSSRWPSALSQTSRANIGINIRTEMPPADPKSYPEIWSICDSAEFRRLRAHFRQSFRESALFFANFPRGLLLRAPPHRPEIIFGNHPNLGGRRVPHRSAVSAHASRIVFARPKRFRGLLSGNIDDYAAIETGKVPHPVGKVPNRSPFQRFDVTWAHGHASRSR